MFSDACWVKKRAGHMIWLCTFCVIYKVRHAAKDLAATIVVENRVLGSVLSNVACRMASLVGSVAVSCR